MPDLFDQAEASLTQQQQQADQQTGQQMLALGPGEHTLPDGTTITNANPAGTPPPAAQPQYIPNAPAPVQPTPPKPTTFIFNGANGGPVQERQGGDVFDQADAQLKLQQGIKNGDNVAPLLARSSAMGVAHPSNDAAAVADAAGHKAANDYFNNPTTSVGDVANGAVPQQVDYKTWSKLRHDFQVNNPNSPLPPDLQVFDWVHTAQKIGEQTNNPDFSIVDLSKAANANTDRPLLHDQGLINEARANLPAGSKMPEVLQGTIEQRQLAKDRAMVSTLRTQGQYPKDFSDQEVLTAHAQQLDDQAQGLIVKALKTDPSFGPGLKDQSDETILQLVRRNPQLYSDAIAKAMLPALASEAAKRQIQRQQIGPLQDDKPDASANDQALINAAHSLEVSQAGADAAKRHPVWGAYQKFVVGASLGIDTPRLLLKLKDATANLRGDSDTSSEERYLAFSQQYQAQHPYWSILANLAGMLATGKAIKAAGPSGIPILDQTIQATGVPGNVIRNAVAETAGQQTLGGAVAAAMRTAAPTAFENAPILSKLAASAAAGGIEMPVFVAVQHLVEGEPKAALQALNMGNADSRLNAAFGATLAPGVDVLLPSMLMKPVKALWTDAALNRAVGSDFDAPFKERGIELSADDKEAALRIARMRNDMQAGKDFWTAAGDNGVGLKDLARVADLLSTYKAAGKVTVEPVTVRRAAARTTTSETTSPETSPKTSPPTSPGGGEPPLPPGSTLSETELADIIRGRADTTGKELLSPRDAMVARAKWLADQYAPRGADGRRHFDMPAFRDLVAGSEANRALVDQVKAESTKAGGMLQHAQELVKIADSEEAARVKPLAPQSIEGRKLPAAPTAAELGEPTWKPKLSSMTAAKARATSKLELPAEVKFGKTQQIAVNQIIDHPAIDPQNVRHWQRKFAPGPENQTDAVPPPIVRKLANGGWQVLDGADQFIAARNAGMTQIPVIEAIGAPAPAKAAVTSSAGKSTGAPTHSTIKTRVADKEALAAAVKPGEIIHGTDARNLQFITKQGLKPSMLSDSIDAEKVPEGGFGKDTPSTAAGYAVGRAKEVPILVVLKPHTNRGIPDRALSSNHVIAASEGKSYVHPSDIDAVVFPDGARVPLDQAEAHYKELLQQRQSKLPGATNAVSTTEPEQEEAPRAEEPKPPAGDETQSAPAGGNALEPTQPRASSEPLTPAGEQLHARVLKIVDKIVGETDEAKLEKLGDRLVSMLSSKSTPRTDRLDVLFRVYHAEELAGDSAILKKLDQLADQLQTDEEKTGEAPAGGRDTATVPPPPAAPTGDPIKEARETLATLNAELERANLFLASLRTNLKTAIDRKYDAKEIAGRQKEHDREVKHIELLTREIEKLKKILPPELPALEHTAGNATTIETAAGEKIPARYALVEAGDVIPSHRAFSYSPDERYPANVQERDYKDKEEKGKINQQVVEFNPAFVLTDNPDPVNGPPMVLKNGLVMGGNSRAITIQEVYGDKTKKAEGFSMPRAATLRAQTLEAAKRFGVDGDFSKMKAPMLVRVLDELPTEPARMRELVKLLQKGRTQELSGTMDAISRARILLDQPDTLEKLQSILGESDSIRDVMSQPSKVADIRDWLVKAGVLSKQEYSRFTNSETGMLSEDGKRLIERTLMAVVVPDATVFDNLPAAITNKIAGNLYALVYPITKGGRWDLSQDLQQALYGYFRWQAAERPPIDAFLKGEGADGQSLMVKDKLTDPGMERAAVLFRRLIGDNSVGWRERARAFLDHARGFTPGEQTFDFAKSTVPTPEKAFADAFERQEPLDRSGKPVAVGKIERKGGGLFAGGPEAHYHDLARLRDMLQWPEGMTPALRGALRLPRRLVEGGPAMMSTAGGKPVDPSELLKDPATAERLTRIATFHLEQHADAGEKLLSRWATDVRSDVGGILKDLGFNVDDAGFDGLLSRLWHDLASDPDVVDALGKLPAFDAEAANGAKSRSTSKGTRSGSRSGGGAGGSTQPRGGLESDTEHTEREPGTDVAAGGNAGAGISGQPGDDASATGWLAPGQQADYDAALNSDRVGPYVPLEPWRGGRFAHPKLLVESKALAGVPRADVSAYQVDPASIVDVSDPQRDQVQQIGFRIHHANAGALIADDVGVGKSRIIGGVIADQLMREMNGLAGKHKILVLTKNRQNIADLVNTFTTEMAGTFKSLLDRNLKIHDTNTLTPEQVANLGDGYNVALGDVFNLSKYGSAYKDWRPDLVIVDEAHLLSNLAGGTERADVLEGLHESLLPGGNTHFVYATATPASDLSALQFMYGLGLWQPPKMAETLNSADMTAGTFDQWLQNATGITKVGSWRESVATPIVEQLMRELKMDGAFASLDFWRGGFEFDMQEAQPTVPQLAMFDAAADTLRGALQLYKSLRPQVGNGKWPHPVTRGKMWSPPRPDGQAIFFIKRLITQFRMPAAIAAAREALARGEQVVFKTLAIEDTALTGDAGNLGAVFDAIPTQKAIKNKAGEVVGWEDIPGAKEAVAQLRRRIFNKTGQETAVSPLAEILKEFGEANVAQIVGTMSAKQRVAQNADFQGGKRRVAVISPAGTTGINLQDLGGGKRLMIALDLDWDSKEFKQTLGRVDRANQLTSPRAITITTPIAGERKFQSTIAVRMKSLGAISKGQAEAGAETDALQDFDMESSTWHRAINETVRALPEITKLKMLRADKLIDDDLSWRDFQNDLMLLPHKLGNEIFERAYSRWKELEDLEQERTGGKVARRNRGMIRASTPLDENPSTALTLHNVESTTGESYGILQGKLLTRPAAAVSLPTIQDAIFGKNTSQVQRNQYVTMQQGDRIVSGLFVPRAKIETVKALFGKASQRALFDKGPDEAGNIAPMLPDSIVDQLPPVLGLHATTPALTPAQLNVKHSIASETISRQDITNQVIRKLQFAVAVGKQQRLRGRMPHALGYYWSKLIRQKTANDIAVLAHEVGHAIDDVLTGLKPPSTFDSELMPLGRRTSRPSYTKMQVRKEGVAEWFRISMFDPVQAATLAPTYSAFFEKALLTEPDLWQATKDLQRMYQAYLAQDPVQKLESQINFDDEGPTERSPLAKEPIGQYLYRNTFDNRAPLNWMRQELEGNDQPLPSEFNRDAYVLSRLLPGNNAMVLDWFKHGILDSSGKMTAIGIEPLLKKHGITTPGQVRKFEAYLVARRAIELYEQTRTKHPVTGEPLRTLKTSFDLEAGPLGVTEKQARATVMRYQTPAFRLAADGVYKFNHAWMDYLRNTGFFDPNSLNMIELLNQNYVPFSRVMDHMEQAAAGNKSLVDKGRQLQQLRGSGRLIQRPLAQMARNMLRIVDNVEGNRAALRLVESILKSGDKRWGDKISRPIAGTGAHLQEIRKALIAAGVDPKDLAEGPAGQPAKIDLGTAFTIFRPIRHNPADMEIALRRLGKIELWQLHVPALYDAITSRSAPISSSPLVKLLFTARNIKTLLHVFSWDFLANRIIRDQITATTMSRYGYKPFLDFARGIVHFLAGDDTYHLWMQSRGAQSKEGNAYADNLDFAIKQLGKSKLRRAVEAALIWNLPRTINSTIVAIQSATPLGEFARALAAEGITKEGLTRAALASRDVTGDFFRAGRWVHEKNVTKAFLNAQFQRSDLLARNVVGRGGQRSGGGGPGGTRARSRWASAATVAVKALSTVTLPSLLLAYLCGKNPDYQERVKERSLYWLIPDGNPLTTRKWFRVRKPMEFGAVFGTLGEAIFEHLVEHDPGLLKELIPDHNSAISMLVALMDDLFVPAVEAATNYDFFFHRKIVPDAQIGLEPALQYTRYTSETAKMLGKYLHMSPAIVDHLIYGYGGGGGKSATRWVDNLIDLYHLHTGENAAPALSPEQYVPGVRMFFAKDLEPNAAQSINDFYALRDRLNTVEGSSKHYSGKELQAYQAANRELLAHAPDIRDGEKALKMLRGQMNGIFEDTTLNGEQKRQRLAAIMGRMINVARGIQGKTPYTRSLGQ